MSPCWRKLGCCRDLTSCSSWYTTCQQGLHCTLLDSSHLPGHRLQEVLEPELVAGQGELLRVVGEGGEAGVVPDDVGLGRCSCAPGRDTSPAWPSCTWPGSPSRRQPGGPPRTPPPVRPGWLPPNLPRLVVAPSNPAPPAPTLCTAGTVCSTYCVQQVLCITGNVYSRYCIQHIFYTSGTVSRRYFIQVLQPHLLLLCEQQVLLVTRHTYHHLQK